MLEKACLALLAWYPSHQRDLPWREDKEPYHIWVSEIMLQQTRVEAVKPYYRRFLQTLPSIESLAHCDEDTLLKLWEGLGFYRRAHNLQRGARQILEEFGGVFPTSYDDIRSLCGVGEYTAGAIGSICYSLPTPAVDGNVLRVIARLLADRRNIQSTTVRRESHKKLCCVYRQRVECGILTQAWMELGAIVCIPNGSPRCEVCPLASLCRAKEEGLTDLLPIREKNVKRREENRSVFILRCDGRIALHRRDSVGLLGGMWELPNCEGFLNDEERITQAREWGCKPYVLEKITNEEHVFSHITWHMEGIYLQCKEPSDRFVWATVEELCSRYSIPTAFRKFIFQVA